MRTLLAFGVLGFAISAASAEDKAQMPDSAPVKAERRYCRTEQIIGSVIPAHICLTKTQWAEVEAYFAKQNAGFIDKRDTLRGGL